LLSVEKVLPDSKRKHDVGDRKEKTVNVCRITEQKKRGMGPPKEVMKLNKQFVRKLRGNFKELGTLACCGGLD